MVPITRLHTPVCFRAYFALASFFATVPAALAEKSCRISSSVKHTLMAPHANGYPSRGVAPLDRPSMALNDSVCSLARCMMRSRESIPPPLKSDMGSCCWNPRSPQSLCLRAGHSTSGNVSFHSSCSIGGCFPSSHAAPTYVLHHSSSASSHGSLRRNRPANLRVTRSVRSPSSLFSTTTSSTSASPSCALPPAKTSTRLRSPNFAAATSPKVPLSECRCQCEASHSDPSRLRLSPQSSPSASTTSSSSRLRGGCTLRSEYTPIQGPRNQHDGTNTRAAHRSRNLAAALTRSASIMTMGSSRSLGRSMAGPTIRAMASKAAPSAAPATEDMRKLRMWRAVARLGGGRSSATSMQRASAPTSSAVASRKSL
mmetsp:Transcript_22577/g.55666  ORF Transcript_22577/g.55666 Transcript_22577/m.55666 type:complete len:370 (-) Transcript_22577:826-1935(-)